MTLMKLPLSLSFFLSLSVIFSQTEKIEKDIQFHNSELDRLRGEIADYEKKIKNTIHNHYLEVDSLIRSIFQGHCPRTNMKWSSCFGCHEERPGHLNSVRSNVDRLLQKMIKLHDDLG